MQRHGEPGEQHQPPAEPRRGGEIDRHGRELLIDGVDDQRQMDLRAERRGDAEILQHFDKDDDETGAGGGQQQAQQQHPAAPGVGDVDARGVADFAADRAPAGARRQHAEGQALEGEQQHDARLR